MMLHEKSDVIQEDINYLEKNYPTNLSLYPEGAQGYKTAIETLVKRKAEVDALAEQEAECHAKDVGNEPTYNGPCGHRCHHNDYCDYCGYKRPHYKEKEEEPIAKKCYDSNEEILVGVPGAYYKTTPAEMQRNDYRRP